MRAALAAVVAFAAVGAGTPATPPTAVLHVPGTVSDISADGGRVAFHVAAGSCGRIGVWAPPTRRPSWVKPDCTDQAVVRQLTLAGSRALWVDYDYGNDSYCALMTATLAHPRPTELPECDPSDADEELHGLAGDGSLFAFSSWYSCDAPGITCSPGKTVTDVALSRVLRGKLKEIGTGSRTVVSVDSGRILLGLDPLVGVDSNGRQLWSWLFHGHSLLAAKLQGRQVVGAVPCGLGKSVCRLVAYTTPSGSSEANRRVPPDASLRDFQDGVAVYLSRGAAHVLRMSDGRDRAYRAPGGRPILDAELERSGLFYSYDLLRGRDRGRIAFVRFADLFR